MRHVLVLFVSRWDCKMWTVGDGEALSAVCSSPVSRLDTSQRYNLKDRIFCENVFWAEETGALCLRWMDLDSGTVSVWEALSGMNASPFVNLVLNFYLCSGFPPRAPIQQPISPSSAAIFLPKRWHRSHTSTLSSPPFPYPHYSSAVHIRLSCQFVFLVLFNLDILLQARQEKSQVAVRKTERGQDGSPESMSARRRTVPHPKQLQCKLLTYLK